MSDATPDASVGELLSALARDMGILVRQEIQLARTEITLKAKEVVRNSAALGAVLPLWLAALIVGAVFTLGGYIFAQRGLSGLRRVDPLPEQAVSSLNADVNWAKEQIR
jgi:hypothetical protein